MILAANLVGLTKSTNPLLTAIVIAVLVIVVFASLAFSVIRLSRPREIDVTLDTDIEEEQVPIGERLQVSHYEINRVPGRENVVIRRFFVGRQPPDQLREIFSSDYDAVNVAPDGVAFEMAFDSVVELDDRLSWGIQFALRYNEKGNYRIGEHGMLMLRIEENVIGTNSVSAYTYTADKRLILVDAWAQIDFMRQLRGGETISIPVDD